MASKPANKTKTYKVCRWYRVMMSSSIDANSMIEAAQKLAQLKYEDFVETEDAEDTNEEHIWSES